MAHFNAGKRLGLSPERLGGFVHQAVSVSGNVDCGSAALQVVVVRAVSALAGADLGVDIVQATANAKLDEGDATFVTHGHCEGVASVVVECAVGYLAVAYCGNLVHLNLLFRRLAFTREDLAFDTYWDEGA